MKRVTCLQHAHDRNAKSQAQSFKLIALDIARDNPTLTITAKVIKPGFILVPKCQKIA